MNGIVLAFCLTSLIAASQDYRNFQLVVATAKSNESRSALQDLYHKGFDGMIVLNVFKPDEQEIHIIVNQDMKKVLESEMEKFGLKLKVLNVSVDSLVKRTLPVIKETNGKREDAEEYNYSQYEPVYKIYDELKRFANTFEKYATLIRLGKSSEGREMLALKISNAFSSRRIIFIQCGIHAREWISHATCMFLIKKILALLQSKSNKNSARTARLYDWVILPVFNVDGYVYSQETDRFWRKSRSKTTNPNCKGVDLNRNWPFHFKFLGSHSSTSPCSSVYRGSGPSSEIEVKNVLSYLKSIQSNLVAFYDLHSYGQNVLYPWAFSSVLAPDAFELSLIAQRSANAMKNVHGYNYATGTPSSLLYSVGGSSMDYVYGKLGIKYSFSMELRGKSSVINFLLPPDQIKPQGEEVLAAILAAAAKFNFKHSIR